MIAGPPNDTANHTATYSAAGAATGTTPISPAISTRHASIKRLGQEHFDVLVVGGGITGAGVALDAAARGLKVALVDQADFAAGTSSKSSKLIHGVDPNDSEKVAILKRLRAAAGPAFANLNQLIAQLA